MSVSVAFVLELRVFELEALDAAVDVRDARAELRVSMA